MFGWGGEGRGMKREGRGGKGEKEGEGETWIDPTVEAVPDNHRCELIECEGSHKKLERSCP